MKFSDEQLKLASKIDVYVRELQENGKNEVEIYIAMADRMSDLKQLFKISTHDEMNGLCARFDGFYHYAKIIENIAEGIKSGEIKV